jgi:hypothetical protein
MKIARIVVGQPGRSSARFERTLPVTLHEKLK